MLNLTDRTVKAWKQIEAEVQEQCNRDPSRQPTAEIQRIREPLYHVLDSISGELYSASETFDEKRTLQRRAPNALDLDGRAVFFANAEPIVRLLLTVGVVPIAHHLVEFLEACISLDPEHVFLLIGEVVLASKRGGYQYESLAANLIVKIIERYLAEYRHILRGKNDCQAMLIKILDIFVLWPAARNSRTVLRRYIDDGIREFE